jgi:hypothetical protein
VVVVFTKERIEEDLPLVGIEQNLKTIDPIKEAMLNAQMPICCPFFHVHFVGLTWVSKSNQLQT